MKILFERCETNTQSYFYEMFWYGAEVVILGPKNSILTLIILSKCSGERKNCLLLNKAKNIRIWLLIFWMKNLCFYPSFEQLYIYTVVTVYMSIALTFLLEIIHFRSISSAEVNLLFFSIFRRKKTTSFNRTPLLVRLINYLFSNTNIVRFQI